MKSRVTVSVIIPVYNTCSYLSRCVHSLLQSTFQDFEILLIDDGSTDGSAEICDRLAKSDSRISTFHYSNNGVSYARNRGVENARGVYVVFVDSDDYVDRDYIEHVLIKENEDFVWAGYKDVYRDKVIRNHIREDKYISVSEMKSLLKNTGRNAFPFTVWSTCYKHSIIKNNHIMFDEQLSLGEDFLFNIKYLSKCTLIRISSHNGYNYEQIHTSLRHRFTPNYSDLFEEEGHIIDRFCEGWSYQVRSNRWHAVLNYYSNWAKTNPELKKICSKKIRECYKNPYYRSVLPYLRKYGTTDQKIESYCMGVYRHGLFDLYLALYIRYKNRHTT